MNYIIANWKMNPKSQKEALALFEAVKKEIKSTRNSEIVICPPALYLKILMAGARGFSFGAQNCHWETSGAFTGEISAPMLAEFGVRYVIVGHSERRQFLGETDEIINEKLKAVLKAKLKPILCVGEKSGEEMNHAVESQLNKDLAGLSVAQMKQILIAYEPVWAIGTGNFCLPDNALSAALFVRRVLTQSYSRFLAEKIPLLYGGSVDSKNASDYILQANMNGLLVGGASLEAAEFGKIINELP